MSRGKLRQPAVAARLIDARQALVHLKLQRDEADDAVLCDSVERGCLLCA